jgi:hypothetical protein
MFGYDPRVEPMMSCSVAIAVLPAGGFDPPADSRVGVADDVAAEHAVLVVEAEIDRDPNCPRVSSTFGIGWRGWRRVRERNVVVENRLGDPG